MLKRCTNTEKHYKAFNDESVKNAIDVYGVASENGSKSVPNNIIGV